MSVIHVFGLADPSQKHFFPAELYAQLASVTPYPSHVAYATIQAPPTLSTEHDEKYPEQSE